MSGRKTARPANHKVRKSRASVSSAKSRRRPTNTPKQEHPERGGDKEGSRQRALQLFPTAQALLTRKRDHGRADAALIALAAGAPIKPNATEIVIRLADRENSYA
jgi:hypothetical protein